MTGIQSFLGHKGFTRRYNSIKDESQTELSRMTNLNSRFMNFLDIVKSETKRGDILKNTLIEQKQEILGHLRKSSSKYHDDLLSTKKSLNDLTFGLNSCQVNERSSRIKMEWFSKLIKFELENLNQKPKLNVAIANSLNFSYQVNKAFDMNSTSNNSSLSEYESSQNFYLSTSSNMSSSQTSLSSMSCTSSASSSSVLEVSESTNITSPDSPQSPCYITDTQVQLENYLTNTKSLRSQLESDYEKKIASIFESKEHVNKLNQNLSELNNDLDLVRTDNYNLSENVKNLKKELDFYRRLNSPNQYIQPVSSKTMPKAPKSGYDRDQTQILKDEAWFNAELEKAKKEAAKEFEQFNKNELNVYEEYLEKNLMDQLEEHEQEFNAEADRIDAESDSILNELTDLNNQLVESVTEYDELSRENQVLNERLISLSNNLCSFSELSENDQDCLIINYTIKTLDRQISTTKADIKNRKKELNLVKSSLIQKDIIDLLEPTEQCLINPKTNPWLNLNTLNPSSLILKQHYSEQKGHHDQVHTSHSSQKPQELKYELNIRPYSTQIEYTKSNLFAYLKLDFDLTRNYCTANSKQNSKNLKTNLNYLRIAMDSIDGHSIVLENSHKILDFDLSEWTLRREIQNYPNFAMFNNSNTMSVPFKIPAEGDIKLMPECENPDSKLIDIIEFKFPKGFKLKRRKKVNLIAAGKKSKDLSADQTNSNLPNSPSSNSVHEESNQQKKNLNKHASNTSLAPNSNINNNTVQSITMNKCACCSCKLLTMRQGDIDIFEAKNVESWGTGLLVVTKFINSKNITKLVNYKCLKHIWINETGNKDKYETSIIESTLMDEFHIHRKEHSIPF